MLDGYQPRRFMVFIMGAACLFCHLLYPSFAWAQDDGDGRTPPVTFAAKEPLRVGLALSGGGAKGIAHVGILEALEEAGVRVDYITGTSMGSLIGGLYAIGYSTEQLVDIILSTDFDELFLDRRFRGYITNYEKLFDDRTIVSFPLTRRGIGLPAGVISGQRIYTYLSRLTWNAFDIDDFNQFPIPFAATGTDLETGESMVFRTGSLADAMRASLSIPSVFAPMEIDGRIYVDGGLTRNLPVQEAIDMGANFVIAVDVGSKLHDREKLTSLAAIMNQTIHFRIIDNTGLQRQLADYLVDVADVREYSSSDFDAAVDILAAGRRTGNEHRNVFRQIAARQTEAPDSRSGMPDPMAIPIDRITIEDNTIYDDQTLMKMISFSPGDSLDPYLIEDTISRLYSSRYIQNVFYNVDRIEEKNILKIRIVETQSNSFGVGVRYDDASKASLLFVTTLHNRVQTGSVSRLEARLGHKVNLGAETTFYRAFGSRAALLSSVDFLSELVQWFDADGRRIAQHDNDIIRAELSWGNYFSTQNLVAAGFRMDFTYHSEEINRHRIPASPKNSHSFYIRFISDNLDRKAFPRHGHRFIAEGFLSDRIFLSETSFNTATFHYRAYHQPLSFFSYSYGIWIGYSRGYELPWGYWYSPNRFDPLYDTIRFPGTVRYELNARNVKMVTAGLQFEPLRNWFIGFDSGAGRFMDAFGFSTAIDEIDYTVAARLGALSLVGPIELSMAHTSRSDFRAELNVGYAF